MKLETIYKIREKAAYESIHEAHIELWGNDKLLITNTITISPNYGNTAPKTSTKSVKVVDIQALISWLNLD